jgi:hypothetical protein
MRSMIETYSRSSAPRGLQCRVRAKPVICHSGVGRHRECVNELLGKAALWSVYARDVWLRVSVLVVSAMACSYSPSFRDCRVSCSAPTDCPDSFTCGPEGFCRAFGEATSCAAVRDARPMEQDAGDDASMDASPGDAPVDAPPIDAPAGTPEYYGCFAIADDTYNCNEVCASEQKTCTTGCGTVWYAYSLAGPCAASQPTSYSGNSCTQRAAIGTGDTIYVQCCCQ